MKRETLRHPKTYDLMARLGCTRPEALGYLTLLWDYVGEVAPRGDIGKWADAAIGRACDWEGEAAEFVAHLVAAGWIDQVDDPAVRLLIHDWPDHCQEFVKAKLRRSGAGFHSYYESVPTVSRRCSDGVATDSALSNPIQSHPIPSNSNGAGKPAGECPAGLLALIDAWNSVAPEIGLTKVRQDPPSKGLTKAWTRAQRTPELRDAVRDVAAIVQALRGATFAHGAGWCTLPGLLSRNTAGEEKLLKLLAGDYVIKGTKSNGRNGNYVGPGQRHPDDIRDDGTF